MGKFNNEKKTKTEGPDHLNRLVQGAEIEGNISTSTSLRIDGKIKGNLKCSGKLVLGLEGEIFGEINCVEAEIEGKINGDIYVAELLYLRASSIIDGNIITPKLIIENGATFNGNCSMKKEQEKLTENNKVDKKNQQEKTVSNDLVY